jgi:hypothetical protein
VACQFDEVIDRARHRRAARKIARAFDVVRARRRTFAAVERLNILEADIGCRKQSTNGAAVLIFTNLPQAVERSTGNQKVA